MAKDANQPKAINIIRPSNNTNGYVLLNSSISLSSSSNSSTASSNSQKRHGSSSSAIGTRKPRVAPSAVVKSNMEKPVLNLYHPPTRKPSYENTNKSSFITRPPIELYKPQQQQQQQKQQKLPKTLTAPSSISNDQLNPHKIYTQHARSTSPSYLRYSVQQQQQTPRSVLGVINTPVASVAYDRTEAIASSDNYHSLPPLFEDDTDNQNKAGDLSAENLSEDFTSDEEEGNNSTIDDVTKDEDGEVEEDIEEEDPINEARVNRKIADLELSIKSLLTVNAMLEATVKKQASQLNQIKKQQSANEHGIQYDSIVEQELIEPVKDNSSEENEEDWETDLLFQKLKKVTENMIEQGQRSLNFEYKILGRVLSNYIPQEDDEDDEEGNTLVTGKTVAIGMLLHIILIFYLFFFTPLIDTKNDEQHSNNIATVSVNNTTNNPPNNISKFPPTSIPKYTRVKKTV
ncbi:MAG: hypothetical protein EXX96DRAFT_566869 [Benjaminiella poitrasii]|nr:MAG: hypothetical protein EXX96DRAFT_566869 [Benjaminiella poitrasii]